MDDQSLTANVQLSYSSTVTSSELNDEDLLSLSVAELNYRLKSVSASERFRLKKLRRTLKNRRHQQTYQKRQPERRRRRKNALHHTDDARVHEVKVSAVFCDCVTLFNLQGYKTSCSICPSTDHFFSTPRDQRIQCYKLILCLSSQFYFILFASISRIDLFLFTMMAQNSL